MSKPSDTVMAAFYWSFLVAIAAVKTARQKQVTLSSQRQYCVPVALAFATVVTVLSMLFVRC